MESGFAIDGFGVALLVSQNMSKTASFVVCVAHSVKDHHDLIYDSQLVKKSCAAQVVLDELFPLRATSGSMSRCSASLSVCYHAGALCSRRVLV